MKKSVAPLLAFVCASLVGCASSSAPLPDTSSAPRPAPGAPTKDVMVPAVK